MRHLSCLVLASLAATLALAGSAPAAETEGESAPPPATAPMTAEPDPSGGAVVETVAADDAASDEGDDGTTGGSDNRGVAVALLIFALLVIGAILVFLERAQGRTFDALDAAIRSGRGVPAVKSVPAFARAAEGAAEIKIEGPAVVLVGEAATYKATVDGAEAPVTWSVSLVEEGAGEPPALTPAEGPATTLTAGSAATFELTATAAGGGSATARVAAIAKAQEAASGAALPFLGEGYGTIIIAVTLIAGAAVLAVLDAFDSAVATLFGALAGYIFLKGVQSGGGGGDAAGGAGATTPPAGDGS